jgi:hypothetical protein
MYAKVPTAQQIKNLQHHLPAANLHTDAKLADVLNRIITVWEELLEEMRFIADMYTDYGDEEYVNAYISQAGTGWRYVEDVANIARQAVEQNQATVATIRDTHPHAYTEIREHISALTRDLTAAFNPTAVPIRYSPLVVLAAIQNAYELQEKLLTPAQYVKKLLKTQAQQ